MLAEETWIEWEVLLAAAFQTLIVVEYRRMWEYFFLDFQVVYQSAQLEYVDFPSPGF